MRSSPTFERTAQVSATKIPFDGHPFVGVSIALEARSIYENSPVTMTARARSAFALRVSGRVLVASKGDWNAEDETWTSSKADGWSYIELELDGWVRERPTDASGADGPGFRYGMRFYPFVSSRIDGAIEVLGASLEIVSVGLPPECRLIWFRRSVAVDGDAAEGILHDLTSERSRYLFPLEAARGARLDLDLPARLGGTVLARYVDFPLYYWSLSLVGLSIAALAATISVSIAAIAALWTVMLRQWSSADLPQQNTLLTAGYGIAALAAAAWALLWRWSDDPVFLVPLSLLFGLLVVSLLRMRRRFTRTGLLPRPVVAPWTAFVTERVRRDESGAS